MKIIFIGTPEFGAIILEELIKNEYKPVLVITSPDKKVGRKQILTPSPVKIIAQKYNIAIGQLEEIKSLKPDLGIVASFGQIIPQKILDIPKHGFINLHPSLLPKHRGPSPIQSAILKGEKETGATIIKMTEKVDAGPIIASGKLKLQNEKLTYKELHDQLAKLGAELLVKTIPDWIEGKIKAKPQEESKATYSKILKKEDGKIDWQKAAELLEREVRAFYPWPGSWTIWENKNKLIKIKVLKTRFLKFPDQSRYPSGKVLVVPQGEEALPLLGPFASARVGERENEIAVQCKKDFLVLEKIQAEGKKEMMAEDFLRGQPSFVGTILK